uniref:Niban apoptosis regulator 2b n=1 Tax=Neolamprologus brichardi TaxID=32507 RepID=A0A3Q4H9B2_NEOBR
MHFNLHINLHFNEGNKYLTPLKMSRTGKVIAEFGRLYEQQHAVALFNKVRFDVEGGGTPQPQLLHRKIPLENKAIFSGSLFQYLEENKKWRNHFLFIPDSHDIKYYDSKAAHDRLLHPKGTISCAGYKVLTSMEQYLNLISNSLPGVKAKVGSSPFLKCATPHPLIMWHPYARHYYFCVTTEKEQQKWYMVLQDCVRHSNNGESRCAAQISDAVHSLVQAQCQTQYEAVLQKCEANPVVLPKAEKLLKVSIQPYISSILEALLEPTSRGFFEVREVFFRELVDMSKNVLNEGTKEMHMEKISMLAFHPVKMYSCYEKVMQLSLEGLDQRFDISSPSVFIQRVQILMREQMDNAVYTFEQILHQSLESQGGEDLCKTIQRCQDRVIKKFDYDSSTVRKCFFREALLQIFIPYMLKQLNPSSFMLVPAVLSVKEAAVQRRHNLYRDSIVLSNSDPNLHLLGDNPSIDWAGQYGGEQEEVDGAEDDGEVESVTSRKKKRGKQVVSLIQVEGTTVLPGESCLEGPGVEDIPEEDGEGQKEHGAGEENSENKPLCDQNGFASLKASTEKPEDNNEPEEQQKEAMESAGEGSRAVAEEQPSSTQEEVLLLPPAPAAQELGKGCWVSATNYPQREQHTADPLKHLHRNQLCFQRGKQEDFSCNSSLFFFSTFNRKSIQASGGFILSRTKEAFLLRYSPPN